MRPVKMQEMNLIAVYKDSTVRGLPQNLWFCGTAQRCVNVNIKMYKNFNIKMYKSFNVTYLCHRSRHTHPSTGMMDR